MEAARAVASAMFPRSSCLPPRCRVFSCTINWEALHSEHERCSPCCRRRRNAKGTREYSSYTSLTRDGAFVVSALSSRGRPLWTSRLANAVLSHGIIALFACSRCSPASNHYSTPVLRAVAAVRPLEQSSESQVAGLVLGGAAHRCRGERGIELSRRIDSMTHLGRQRRPWLLWKTPA